MAIAPLPTRDLLGVFKDNRLATVSNYWRTVGGLAVHQSTRPEIIFEKITSSRRIAPHVLPANTGKPTLVKQGSAAQMFSPGYIKAKDPVLPGEQFSRQPGDLFTDVPRTPQANFDMAVADVVAYHRQIIERRWEYMAAKAVITGTVDVEYVDSPKVTVDFGRAAGHTIDATASQWAAADTDLLENIESWADTMATADFGGIANRLTVSPEVWAVMRKNTGIINEMSTQRRGNTETNIRTGITVIDPNNMTKYVGTVGAGIDVYVTADFYQNNAGSQVKYLPAKSAVLTAPGIDAVMAFGAIVDADANLQASPVFMKMWKENDPSAMFIMSQSAPLYIPVNPNCSMLIENLVA